MSVAAAAVVVDIMVFATCLIPRRILKNYVHMMWTIEWNSYNSNRWIDDHVNLFFSITRVDSNSMLLLYHITFYASA